MNLQQVKPNRHNRLQVLCSECCKMKDESKMFADLDDRPFTYVCHECAPTYKGVNNG